MCISLSGAWWVLFLQPPLSVGAVFQPQRFSSLLWPWTDSSCWWRIPALCSTGSLRSSLCFELWTSFNGQNDHLYTTQHYNPLFKDCFLCNTHYTPLLTECVFHYLRECGIHLVCFVFSGPPTLRIVCACYVTQVNTLLLRWGLCVVYSVVRCKSARSTKPENFKWSARVRQKNV